MNTNTKFYKLDKEIDPDYDSEDYDHLDGFDEDDEYDSDWEDEIKDDDEFDYIFN